MPLGEHFEADEQGQTEGTGEQDPEIALGVFPGVDHQRPGHGGDHAARQDEGESPRHGDSLLH